jgi:hypothetical protein
MNEDSIQSSCNIGGAGDVAGLFAEPEARPERAVESPL